MAPGPTRWGRFSRRVIALALVLGPCGCARPPVSGDVEHVTIKGETFALELSIDDEARTRGLMGRESVSPDGGMLFIFPDADVRSFWMKGCLTDIDVMYLDARGRVTATWTMQVEPPRTSDESETEYERRLSHYSSRYPSQFAIELAPGTIRRLGIRYDDRIELDLERLKGMAR